MNKLMNNGNKHANMKFWKSSPEISVLKLHFFGIIKNIQNAIYSVTHVYIIYTCAYMNIYEYVACTWLHFQ